MEQPGPPGAATGEPFAGAQTADDRDRESRLQAQVSGPTIRALLGLLLMVNLAMSLYQLPLNRVIERRLCIDHYLRIGGDSPIVTPGGDVNEALCKIDEVQQGLARLQQIMDITWILGDILMTIPLGFVAEKYGRRTVLLLNLVPRAAMLSWAVVVGYFDELFPAHSIILAPFLSILGGDCVFNSVTYALAAGMTEDTVTRAKYFGYMTSITYIVNLTGPALASATMSILLWFPFGIGLVLLALAARFTVRIPEERRYHHIVARSDEEARLLDPNRAPCLRGSESSTRDDPKLPPIHIATAQTGPDAPRTAFRAIKRRFQVLHAVLTSRSRNFSLLLFSMFLTSLASADTKLLVQYISKRYHRTFAAAGYILSSKAVVNFVLLTIVVPTLLDARRRRLRHHPERGRSRTRRGSPFKNLSDFDYTKQDALVCLGISVVGALAVGIATTIWTLIPSLFLYALGSALPIFTFSLLNSPWVSPSQPAAASDAVMVRTGLSSQESQQHGESVSGPPSSPTAASSFDAGGGEHETTVFSIVMLVKTIGSLVGVPVVTSVWIRAIGLGGFSLGLPYIVSAAFYAAAIAVIIAIKVG